MTDINETELAEVVKVHNAFWQCLANRKVDERFDLCWEDVTFIGTGLGEYASNKEEYKAINLKGLGEYEGVLSLNIEWLKTKVIGEVAWVESYIEWYQKINGKDYFEKVRNTVIFRKNGYSWKISHVHGSSPDYRLHSGEFMTNETTVTRNKELEKLVLERTEALQHSIHSLKNAQETIIQAEKMASLGELTAGIAHEIQNPLNFVNNFSEVSLELLDEMMEEMQNLPLDNAFLLGATIKENLTKIHSHGQRAESIVKSMLQHSRKDTGKKEMTDINILCDEYMRLSYYGLKAKYKNFKANFTTNFDLSLGKILVEPQGISRVILNLINNAFYAVNERDSEENDEYAPLVSISTHRSDHDVTIIVKDNGKGIPDDIMSKIFQPFFTTKPSGRGTGLGLSMSYEIITQGHNGEITVESEEGSGSEFTIKLPLGEKLIQ
jgi:signal transduction histidine kinase